VPQKWWVYVGTYPGGGSKGIYRFEMDVASGKLASRQLAAETAIPSFLVVDPSHHFLYAVNEVADFKGKKSGAVSAFALDAKSGDLTSLNQQSSGGPGPCHLTIDNRGKHVLAANYAGGSVCVLPVRADGSLGKATAFEQHHGKSVNPDRQEGPHGHCATLDAANRFAFVCDLGLDKVMVYRFDARDGTLTPNDPPSATIAEGSGPRHLAFHPDGRHAYVINELKSTVTAFSYDGKRGVLKTLQTVSTLPEGFTGENTTAEVMVHPSGKFLYGSNRGHNSIVTFAIDPKTGKLSYVARQSKQIKTPRGFAIDPTGTYMVVGNQDSNSLVVFRIDPGTGELKPTGVKVDVPMPVSVIMIPQAG
jgi:6-phosphogluconolactonase